jgi:hypothetical protein
MLLTTNCDKYYGCKIIKITDRYGNKHRDLNMKESVNIHLNNGEIISLALDWRGNDVYISQKVVK